MKTIVTNRLILRDWKLSESADLFEYASQPIVGVQGGWKPHKTEAESKDIIQWFIESNEIWALEHKIDEKVIGSIGLHHRYPDNSLAKATEKQVEIGYALHPRYWGKGLMPEATKQIIQYAFDVVHVDWIWCGHFEDNHQAKRVSEKCGFIFQFRTQKILPKLDDKVVTIDYFSMNKQQFIKSYNAL